MTSAHGTYRGRAAGAADGREILDDVADWIRRYVAFPDRHCAPVVALWAAHSYVSSSAYVTPRLVLSSAEPGSGKSRVLELLALLCHNAKVTVSTTTAALYRRIGQALDEGMLPPTVLMDEVDAIFGKQVTPQTEDLRALLNAGYKRGATVDRCEGDAKKITVREFPVFAPVALAGLAGRMPRTITTRAVTVHMRRRAPDERVAQYRERDAEPEADKLRSALSGWVAGHAERLAEARPVMPDGVVDRPAEVWEILLAIADLAGGHWPATARAACKHFVLDTTADDPSLGVLLLRDCRDIFEGRDRVTTEELIVALRKLDEAPWSDLHGRMIDPRRLAQELKRYGVKSKTLKLSGGGQAKGYRADGDGGFADAWKRYL